MAEIRIERKGRGLGWLWLLLALVVVAVLAWYFLYPGRTTPPPAAAPPTTGALDNGPATHGVVIAGGTPLQQPGFRGGSYGKQG